MKGPQEGPRGQALPMNTPGARRREKLGPRLGRPALPPPDRRKDGGAKAHAAGVSFSAFMIFVSETSSYTKRRQTG